MWLFGPSFSAPSLTSSNQALESLASLSFHFGFDLWHASSMAMAWYAEWQANANHGSICTIESSVEYNSWFAIVWHGYALVKHFWLKSSILHPNALYMFSYCNTSFLYLWKPKLHYLYPCITFDSITEEAFWGKAWRINVNNSLIALHVLKIVKTKGSDFKNINLPSEFSDR